MRKSGLATGSFDFIIDLKGDYVFLEVNESGQFLFLQSNDSSIPTLDAFSKFLESGDPNFTYSETDKPLTYEGFKNSLAFEQYLKNIKTNQFLDQVKLIQFE
jgi:hypothetical protein